MELLHNKTPKESLENIHKLFMQVILTNKEELVKVNGDGAIADNYKATNNSYIVFFTSIPYTLQ